jgi:hypothetical protein
MVPTPTKRDIMAAKALKIPAVPLSPGAAAQQRLDTILACAGNLDGARTFIAAEHGVELLCALIRQGCLEATCLKPGMKADQGDYDLVLIPDIGCLATAEEAIRVAHRALAPWGRVVMGVADTGAPRHGLGLTRRLRLNGFRAIRTTPLPGFTIVQADAPPGGWLS